MQHNSSYIVVTGAAGFIGSCLLSQLQQAGFDNLVAVDDFSRVDKQGNLANLINLTKVERTVFVEWLNAHATQVQFVFHLGARTDTTEFNRAIFEELNIAYSKQVWQVCTKHRIPLVYASSAATYGLGELGYADDHATIPNLKPLNPYGDSKQWFDEWVLQQTETPPFWAGLKFFNVYGPNEYHKGRMASVVFHAFNQIQQSGAMKLFRSHNPKFKDGEQLRDFIYVKDLLRVCLFLMKQTAPSGIYNLGSGKARTFLDLVKATFAAMQMPEQISFIDTPADIRDTYQYYTQADMSKLRKAGFDSPFTELEEGVHDYVTHYLMGKRYL